jgi:MYXO-CTERM domain-containing protein
MSMKRGTGAVAFFVVASAVSSAGADVPAGYTGTPFNGTPKQIPGRINLVDYDTGGMGVGFQTVHFNGDVKMSGPEYRTDRPAPTLCRTYTVVNEFNTKPDTYTAGPLNGTFYPSTDVSKPAYYIGAIRPGDWVKVTVNVATAGAYTISSHWASPAANIDYKIYFNDVVKNETKAAATGDYHNWVPFPSFATVELAAGIQVMKFESVQEHLNLGYVEFALAGGDGGVVTLPDAGGEAAVGAGGAAGAGGAVNAGGAGGSTATGGAGGSTATGGAGGFAATGGAGGSTAAGGYGGSTANGGTGGSTAAGGSGGATSQGGAGGSTAAAGNGGTTSASAATAAPSESGGCACRVGTANRSRSSSALAFVSLLAALGLGRRRRRIGRAVQR